VGLEEDLRIITPKKGSALSYAEESFNKKVGTDRYVSFFIFNFLKI
jgi:hypothetical protein